MTQRDRVLYLLKNAGPRGVHTFELRAQYIGNPSQRIAELEALGHRITHTRERLNGSATGTRYKLLSQAGAGLTPASSGGGDRAERAPRASVVQDTPATVGRLFDPVALSKPAGAYDDVDAAA